MTLLDRAEPETAASPIGAASLRVHLAERLAGDPMVEDVLARWDRWGPDLLTALAQIYPDATDLPERVVGLIAAGHRDRSESLRAR